MYVIIDGIDGAGKTSVCAEIADKIRKRGYTPISLVEPSYGQYGKKIRNRLTASKSRNIEEERNLFTQDRIDHVERTIEPLLYLIKDAPNFIIIQDRGFLSYPAYQALNDNEIDTLLEEHRKITPKPNFIFILDIPPAKAMERLLKNRKEISTLENEHILNIARNRYLSMPHREGNHVIIINADQKMDLITSQILEIMGTIFKTQSK